jgi:serine/threonine protein phosphatase PrpC
MVPNPRQQPAEAPTPFPRTRPRLGASPVRVDVSGVSHKGKVRPRNEDHFLIMRLGRFLETVLTSLPPGEIPARVEEAGYAIVVADGMGGHAGGELASRMAIRELVRFALAMPDWIVLIDEATSDEARRRSKRRIQNVNTVLLEHSRQDPSLRGMGSTLTAARNLGRVLQIAHVGDSRAYLLRNGALNRLTRDHTYVQMLVDLGQLSKEDAARSSARHVLTNAVGGFSDEVTVDVDRLDLANGDRVLLCSDGLTDMVDDDAIRAVLLDNAASAPACERLLERALAAGGKDNITAVVASYAWSDSDEQTAIK